MGLALASVQTMWRPLFQPGSAFAKIFKEQCVTFLRLGWVMKLSQGAADPHCSRGALSLEKMSKGGTLHFGWEMSSRNVPSSLTHTNQNLALTWPPNPHWHMFNAVLPTDPTFTQHIYSSGQAMATQLCCFFPLYIRKQKKEDGKKCQKYVLAINRLLNCLACFIYFIAQLRLSVLHSKESFSTSNPELWFKQHSIRNFCVQQNTTNYNQHWRILIWH